MSEEITFLPTFTGEAIWWKEKETAEVFCKAPVLRAIFRDGYKLLKLSLGTAATRLGCPSEILLEWNAAEGHYCWGEGSAYCQIKPELPDIGLLSGSWFLFCDKAEATGVEDFDEVDPDEVDIEEAVDAALEEVPMEDEEYRFRITLTPLQVNIS